LLIPFRGNEGTVTLCVELVGIGSSLTAYFLLSLKNIFVMFISLTLRGIRAMTFPIKQIHPQAKLIALILSGNA